MIRAKIRPPLIDGWVARPRPEALLAEALETHRVVMVSATAGAGKTTLIAAVTRRLNRPIAWLTVDWTDTAPDRLVPYLEAALSVAVPRVRGIANRALATGIPYREAVGLLFEAAGGEDALLVVDDLERLGEEPEAWAVVEAVLRHAPDDMRFVLSSRRPIPAEVLPRHPDRVAEVGDDVLALTVEEARAVLDHRGRPTVDVEAAVRATGGWLTGVLFDPLDTYLAGQVLGGLSTKDREFLVATSMFEDITAARAAALGVADPGARLSSLRHKHIPGVWTNGGHALRCHPCFREYLRAQLAEVEPVSGSPFVTARLMLALGTDLPATLPADDLPVPIRYWRGELARVLETAAPTECARPWVIAAMAAAGRTPQALDLLGPARGGTALDAVVAPRVLTDAGRRDEALRAMRHGRLLARENSSPLYELLVGVEEARLRLRLDRDPAAALAVLDSVDPHRIGFLGSQVDCWYGFALLLAGRDAEALARLRRAVAVLRRTGLLLELPTAGVYLAEAEWRRGNEDAADNAADLALDAARCQGFNHLLLQALSDFPAVLCRRLDAEPIADSRWHELGRALRAQRVDGSAFGNPSVRLIEFGRCAITVHGAEVRPRIAKTYELLAYLLSGPRHRAGRDELLDALFDGRADESTRAYLRQAVRWLRAVLPPDTVVTERATVALNGRLAVAAESVDLRRVLAEAARKRDADRLAAILSALQIIDRGPYLPGIDSAWVDRRRRELEELVTDARYEAAGLAFSAGRLEHAERLIDIVLDADPVHEAAWRLAMRLANARGDGQGVLRSFQRCERGLATLGATPSATTRQLVDQLRS